jgi:hypothetical protein
VVFVRFVVELRIFAPVPEEEKKVLQKALNGCIKKGILREFLIEHSSEVINMIFTEWNWDRPEEQNAPRT